MFESCRFRKMLKNAYLDAKIGVDTAENEPSKVFLIFFDFHPPQGFNFHIRIAPATLFGGGRMPAAAPITPRSD